MNVLSEMMNISQLYGEINSQTGGNDSNCLLTSSHLPCACPSCQIHLSSGAYIYKEDVKIVTHVVSQKIETWKKFNEFGVLEIKINELLFELTKGGLKYTGNKQEMVERMPFHY